MVTKILNSGRYREDAPLTEQEKKLISMEEKSFYFDWINNGGYDGSVQSITLPSIENPSVQREIRYLTKTAKCEYTKQKKRFEDGTIMPKSERVNIAKVAVIFIELLNGVSALICENNEYNTNRAIKFIGRNNLSRRQGDLISPDMFHWLFYSYMRQEGELSSDLKLENITGFTGNIIDDQDVFEGNSDQTANLIITKAFISNGYPVKKMKIVITSDDGQISFLLDEYMNSKISKSSFLSLLFNNEEDDTTIPIYLYSFVVPRLAYLYNKVAVEYSRHSKSEFSSEIGKDVILSIANNNQINLKALRASSRKRRNGCSKMRKKR